MGVPVLVTGPALEPLTLDEVRQDRRVDGHHHDAMLRRQLRTAREWAEAFTRRRLITQTVDWSVSGFGALVRCPLPPLQSVTSITYVDSAGDSQTLGTSIYEVIADVNGGSVVLANGQSWPSTYEQALPITIRMVVGYGLTGDDVPGEILDAILMRVGRLYEVTEPVVVGASVMDTDADRLMLLPYQVPVFG